MLSLPTLRSLGTNSETVIVVISKIFPKVLFSVATGFLNPSALFYPPTKINSFLLS